MRITLVALLSGLLLTACDPDVLKEDSTDVVLRILKVTGISGHDGEEGDFILSDVNPAFNDNVTLLMIAWPKNPDATYQGFYFPNSIMLEQYEVRYFRTDGHNVEGVDVPYRITGVLGTQVPVYTEVSLSFVAVRQTAKFEPPLRNLRDVASEPHPLGGGLMHLTCMAQITIYGRTAAGKVISQNAAIQITFSDWGVGAET